MKIYELDRRYPDDINYDENVGFVIVATSPRKARELASNQACDEGWGTWIDSKSSKIRMIGEAKDNIKEGIILRSFNAG